MTPMRPWGLSEAARLAIAPEATANPIAEPAASVLGIDMQTDNADQYLVLVLRAGDGQVICAASGQFIACGQDPVVRELPRVGKWHDGQIPGDFPVVDQPMHGLGIRGDQGPQNQPFRRELRFQLVLALPSRIAASCANT